MERKIDLYHNSEKDWGMFRQIASGHISETAILFENEGIVAVVQARGEAAFYDLEDNLLGRGRVPGANGGREVYEEVRCRVRGNLLSLEFPIYEWIDNYPHCDGEHDRWDTRIVGHHTLTLDRDTNTVTCG